MEKLAVERSIWIDAPRERVWKAIAEPEEIAQWFVSPYLGAQLSRDANGTLSISMFGTNAELALLELSDPPQQMTSRSLPDKQLVTTYRLDEEKGGTRVTVTMTGFEALPGGAGHERLGPSGAAWDKALQNLKAYVDGAALPFPEGYNAALFGFRREAVEKYSLERSIWIAAPRERVWQAVTDPKQIQQWFSPSLPWRATALEVGGRLSVYNAETDSDAHTEVIEVFDPPRVMSTRSVPEPPALEQVTTWTLDEENGGTRVTVTSAGYEFEAVETRHTSMEQNAFGYGMMLANLQAYVDGRELPFPGGF